MYDLILNGGDVFDGSGKAPYLSDLALKDDLVCAIGKLNQEQAEFIYDMEGKALAPGFIDVHTQHFANNKVARAACIAQRNNFVYLTFHLHRCFFDAKRLH